MLVCRRIHPEHVNCVPLGSHDQRTTPGGNQGSLFGSSGVICSAVGRCALRPWDSRTSRASFYRDKSPAPSNSRRSPTGNITLFLRPVGALSSLRRIPSRYSTIQSRWWSTPHTTTLWASSQRPLSSRSKRPTASSLLFTIPVCAGNPSTVDLSLPSLTLLSPCRQEPQRSHRAGQVPGHRGSVPSAIR